MLDFNYLLVSELDTKQLPDGTWERWAKVEGKGNTLQECLGDLSFKQAVACGTLFKAIEMKLVEKPKQE